MGNNDYWAGRHPDRASAGSQGLCGILAERVIKARFCRSGLVRKASRSISPCCRAAHVSSEVAEKVVTLMREVGTFCLGDALQ